MLEGLSYFARSIKEHLPKILYVSFILILCQSCKWVCHVSGMQNKLKKRQRESESTKHVLMFPIHDDDNGTPLLPCICASQVATLFSMTFELSYSLCTYYCHLGLIHFAKEVKKIHVYIKKYLCAFNMKHIQMNILLRKRATI